ncbi:hypothetical protein COTS27_00906 [Spirochaetota bacterium]|nr:hypothetical protein COTS27_00906 [Spirochaetota bacterium]
MAVGKKKSTQKKISKRISKKTEKKSSQNLPIKNQNLSGAEDINKNLKLFSANGIPDEVKNKLKIFSASIREESTGPIPSPTHMKGYQGVDASFPKRILKDHEKKSEHNRQMQKQKKLIDSHIVIKNKDVTTERLGLYLAGIIFLSAVLVSAFISYNGRNLSLLLIIPSLLIIPLIFNSILYFLKRFRKPRD